MGRYVPNIIFCLLLACFAALCFGSVFAVSDAFIDTRTLPKWYAFALGLSLVIAAMALSGREGRDLMRRRFYLLVLIVITVCLAQAVYGIFQFLHILPAFGKLRVTGSFDNPAGLAAAMCAGLPFALCLWHDRRKWMRYFAVAAALIMVAAVCLTCSRAGIVSVIVVISIVAISKTSHKIAARQIIIALLPILLAALYFVKRDSADGRLLIWRCSLEMVADKPVFGHGPGGFTAHYMDYQAGYFREHPDSPYARLADTVHHPFNEYLLVAVDYGLFGLLVLGALGYVALRRYRKQDTKDPAVRAAGLSLISIGVFALFSYPFLYPFTWVAMLFSLWIIFGRPWPVLAAVRIVAVVAAASVCVFALLDMRCRLDWCKANRMPLAGNTETIRARYEQLHGYFAHDRFFLYNYAVKLSDLGRYDRSLVVARDCSRIWADYYLQLVSGDDCMKQERYEQAEEYFRQAAAMCPARFIPPYKLATIYAATGRTAEARTVAAAILEKEIKVPSSAVYAVRHKMRQLIDSTDNRSGHTDSLKNH